MAIKIDNLNKVIQFSLLCAGEEDSYMDRNLGLIHFIKYVYLADLAYAKKHNGNTYTGIEWQFYKFGPWSQKVNESIENALSTINVHKTVLERNFSNEEYFRWSYRDSNLLTKTAESLPLEIYIFLKKIIKKFTNNTYDLLDFVYKTPPMLSAKPNDILKFDCSTEKKIAKEESLYESLSNKKKKQLKTKLLDFKEKLKKKEKVNSELINPFNENNFDSTYFEGLNWLDELAGNKVSSGDIDLTFDDDVWLSNTRKDLNELS